MSTDVGGVVAARPHDRGVEISADLTAEDQFAGSSIYFGKWMLGDVSEIDFTMAGDEMRLIIQMDLGGDGDFLEWVEVEVDKERVQGFAGDDRAISTYQTEGPVTAEDAIFTIPPGGSKGSTRGISIADLQNFGDVPVWIGAGLDHRGLDLPDSRKAVITEFSVTSA